jgi:hypothetical protein
MQLISYRSMILFLKRGEFFLMNNNDTHLISKHTSVVFNKSIDIRYLVIHTEEILLEKKIILFSNSTTK